MEGTWDVHPPAPAGAARPTRPGWCCVRRPPRPSASRWCSTSSAPRRRTSSSATSAPTCSVPTGTPSVALANLRAEPDVPIGDALLDQRNLAGIGNVFKSELCFLGGVDPLHPGRRRPRPALHRRQGQAAARGQQGPPHPDHHRRPPPRLPALGLRPPRPLPALRHPDPEGRPGPARPGAADVLVPAPASRCWETTQAARSRRKLLRTSDVAATTAAAVGSAWPRHWRPARPPCWRWSTLPRPFAASTVPAADHRPRAHTRRRHCSTRRRPRPQPGGRAASSRSSSL